MELNWHQLQSIDHWRLSPYNDEPFSRSILLQMMRERGIIPSPAQIATRAEILKDLGKIVKIWIKDVGDQRGIKDLSAAVVPYGSYGLKVYNGSSDIDILVIAPELVSMEPDFFVLLRENIETKLPVINMRSIRSARVPLLKFNIHEVDVDLACARLKTTNIPRAEILHEQEFSVSSAVDLQSRLTLESVKSNRKILQCVQANVENFVRATCFLKYWADRRGIYGNINGYIGGIHLVVMVAYICKTYRMSSFAGVIFHFFATFSKWSWDSAVVLHGAIEGTSDFPPMPIQKPGTNTLCQSNVTLVTLTRIRQELQRGHYLTQMVVSHAWSSLLDEFPYEEAYHRFIKVCLFVTDNEVDRWMGFVKSRLLVLVKSLEAIGINCDPRLVEFRDLPPRRIMDPKDNNRVFLWGIINDSGKKYDVTGPEQNWRNNLAIGNGGLMGQVKLAVIPLDVYRKYKELNMVKRT